MCTAPKAPSYTPPPAPTPPTPSQVANSQFGNVLSGYLNANGAFGIDEYQAARGAGLTNNQIRNLLPTSGAAKVGNLAAERLGVSAGPVLNPTQQLEAQYARQQEREFAIAQKRYNEQVALQKAQYEQSMKAQQSALQAQLAQQDALAKRSEEAALRAQVPQLTANSANATRVRSTSASRNSARSAAQGTSQLRVPLGISSSGMGAISGLTNTSPVKLNIG